MTKKKKKVYIVTSGEYSDYRIDAAFEDEHLAEYFVAARNAENDYRDYCVEEYDLFDSAIDVSDKRKVVYIQSDTCRNVPSFTEVHREYELADGFYPRYAYTTNKKISITKYRKIEHDMKTEYEAKKAGWL